MEMQMLYFKTLFGLIKSSIEFLRNYDSSSPGYTPDSFGP